jgi:PmbA protein
MGFNGKSILLGTSPLKGKLGERVFDRRFSLVDDGTLELASRSCGYDDEGVPTSKKQLIEKGEVKQFLYDLRTAGQAGVSSTGNGLKESFFGGKNFRNPPGIAPTSWVVSEGEMSFEEMVSGLKEGLIVEQVIGLGQGNIMSGEFSNNVAVGYKIEGGEIKGRVKNVMIAGNVYDLLKDKLLAVGDKAQWAFGGFKAPALLIDGVSVVGRG